MFHHKTNLSEGVAHDNDVHDIRSKLLYIFCSSFEVRGVVLAHTAVNKKVVEPSSTRTDRDWVMIVLGVILVLFSFASVYLSFKGSDTRPVNNKIRGPVKDPTRSSRFYNPPQIRGVNNPAPHVLADVVNPGHNACSGTLFVSAHLDERRREITQISLCLNIDTKAHQTGLQGNPCRYLTGFDTDNKLLYLTRF